MRWGPLGILSRALLCLVLFFAQAVSAGEGTRVSPSAGAASVHLGDTELFSIATARGRSSAATRALTATRILEQAAREGRAPVTISLVKDVALVRVGDRTVVELGEGDRAASPFTELKPYAQEIAGRIRRSLDAEWKRREIARAVLSVSSVVFLGLLAWLAMGLAGRVARRAQRRIEESAAGSEGIRIQQVELIPPLATREALRLAVVAGLWTVRLGLLYSWTLLALSLFVSTRQLASKATGFLLAPALESFGRLASRVPLLLALGFAFLVLLLVVRFVRLYFGAVERGEIENGWLSRETAGTSGILAVVAICLAALLFITPLLAGTADGVLTRIGLLGVGAIALGSTPVLGSCLLGLRIVYGRAWATGDLVEYGGEKGRVARVGLFDALLERDDGARVRVPHLMSLWHPTRIYPAQPPPSSQDLRG